MNGQQPVEPKPKEEPDPDHGDLSSYWEVMHDPVSSRPFYINHARGIMMWERLAASAVPSFASSVTVRSSSSRSAKRGSSRGMKGTPTGFGFVHGKGMSSKADRGHEPQRTKDSMVRRSATEKSSGFRRLQRQCHAPHQVKLWHRPLHCATPPATVVLSLLHLQLAQIHTLNLQSTESKQIDSSVYYYN